MQTKEAAPEASPTLSPKEKKSSSPFRSFSILKKKSPSSSSSLASSFFSSPSTSSTSLASPSSSNNSPIPPSSSSASSSSPLSTGTVTTLAVDNSLLASPPSFSSSASSSASSSSPSSSAQIHVAQPPSTPSSHPSLSLHHSRIAPLAFPSSLALTTNDSSSSSSSVHHSGTESNSNNSNSLVKDMSSVPSSTSSSSGSLGSGFLRSMRQGQQNKKAAEQQQKHATPTTAAAAATPATTSTTTTTYPPSTADKSSTRQEQEQGQEQERATAAATTTSVPSPSSSSSSSSLTTTTSSSSSSSAAAALPPAQSASSMMAAAAALSTATLDNHDMEDEDLDMDSDNEDQVIRLLSTPLGSPGGSGPYQNVNHRSLSTPNLHSPESDPILFSPASSPPSSPSLSSTSISPDPLAMTAFSLENAQHASPSAGSGASAGAGAGASASHATNKSGLLNSKLLSLSPESSPKSSPRLGPQLTSHTVTLNNRNSAFYLNLNSQPPATTGATTAATTGSNSNSNTSGGNPSYPSPPPVPPGSGGTRTLRSSKKKTINRRSAVSMFDNVASSVTLPSNFARKGSLPQDAAGAAHPPGLADLFAVQPQELANTPFSLTLAEFRFNDIYPKRQRRLLTVIHRMDRRLRQEGIVKKLTKEQLKGRPDKEILKPDRKLIHKEYKKSTGGGFMAQKIPTFLRSKKQKKKTRPVILHNIEMAIRDRKPEIALQFIADLPHNALKKKKKKSYSDLNHCMLLAMIYRMERVAIELYERGFPVDVNFPILGQAKDDHKTKSGRTGPFEYPSYFLVAVGLGMGELVRAMVKNANLNQSWSGLTPLLLATTLNECTNATCPPPTLPPAKLASMLSRGEQMHLDMASQTLVQQLPSNFNKPIESNFRIPGYSPTSPSSIVKTLLEYGADPNLGITLQQYFWATKLKGMGVLKRRLRNNDPKSLLTQDNPLEFYIAAKRHESGRQWLSHTEIKARKAMRASRDPAVVSKQRFSPELQQFWQGKWIMPVELAIASGNFDCARAILQRLSPQSLEKSSFGLLLQNDVMLTLSLIKSGSPVNQHDLHGCTPLHLAARRGHIEMVMVLLQLGGDVNSKGERQWTPLHESVSQNHAQISSLLVACGAQLDARNEAGETPEMLGKRRGLAPDVLATHFDGTGAKTSNNNGFLHSISDSMMPSGSSAMGSKGVKSHHGGISQRGSQEQLTSTTLASMLTGGSGSNNRLSNAGRPLSGLSDGQAFTNMNGGATTLSNSNSSNNLAVSNSNGNGGGNGSGSSKRNSLQFDRSLIAQQELYQTLNGSKTSLSNTGGSASGTSSPQNGSVKGSSGGGSSPHGSQRSEKTRKKVRGFLKNIFS